MIESYQVCICEIFSQRNDTCSIAMLVIETEVLSWTEWSMA